MRIDHHAYQRATNIASLGLVLQVLLGSVMLAFGLLAGDTVFRFGAVAVYVGIIPWLGLLVIFVQHAHERLESIELDESGRRSTSIFEGAAEALHLQARRLRLMHTWLMPGLSLLTIAMLGGAGWWMLRFLGRLDDAGDAGTVLLRTDHMGWAVAVCLGFAVVAFIFSRFVAGMARVTPWQNLRGGSSWMVGSALVFTAIAIGVIFRFFDNEAVHAAMAWAIPVAMLVLALEIVLNLVLNLYRPRVPGEYPRPAFDSKSLSMLAAPDSLVKTLNEAVNYQFGFDITSTWGYQLLLRSTVGLVGLGVTLLLLLSTMVVVEPHQQALRIRQGRIVTPVHSAGLMWKLPWPLERAEVLDVGRIRELKVTLMQIRERGAYLWVDDLQREMMFEPEPFIVGASRLGDSDGAGGGDNAVGDVHALVDVQVTLRYRVREDPAGAGLLEYRSFTSDRRHPRQKITERERTLQAMALSQLTRYLSGLSLDQVLSVDRAMLSSQLRERIQEACDRLEAGVEIHAVDLPILQPAGTAAANFEELAMSLQAREQLVAKARRDVDATYHYDLGDPGLVDEVLAGLDRLDEAKRVLGTSLGSPGEATARQAVRRHQSEVERLLFLGGGGAARLIAGARRDRWVDIMARRSQASRVTGQGRAWRAAPELYRQRSIMQIFMDNLQDVRKYVVAMDPRRMHVDVDLSETNPLLNFSESINNEGVEP